MCLFWAGDLRCVMASAVEGEGDDEEEKKAGVATSALEYKHDDGLDQSVAATVPLHPSSPEPQRPEKKKMKKKEKRKNKKREKKKESSTSPKPANFPETESANSCARWYRYRASIRPTDATCGAGIERRDERRVGARAKARVRWGWRGRLRCGLLGRRGDGVGIARMGVSLSMGVSKEWGGRGRLILGGRLERRIGRLEGCFGDWRCCGRWLVPRRWLRGRRYGVDRGVVGVGLAS